MRQTSGSSARSLLGRRGALERAGSDIGESRSSDLEDLRLAAVTCASEVLRLVRVDTEHAVALTADRNLPAVGYAGRSSCRRARERRAAPARSKVARSASLRARDLSGCAAGSRRAVLPGPSTSSRATRRPPPPPARPRRCARIHRERRLRGGGNRSPRGAIVTCVLDDDVNVNIIKRRGEDGGDVRGEPRNVGANSL